MTAFGFRNIDIAPPIAIQAHFPCQICGVKGKPEERMISIFVHTEIDVTVRAERPVHAACLVRLANNFEKVECIDSTETVIQSYDDMLNELEGD